MKEEIELFRQGIHVAGTMDETVHPVFDPVLRCARDIRCKYHEFSGHRLDDRDAVWLVDWRRMDKRV